jgi:hypothetical protein
MPMFEKFLDMLNDLDDVQNVYHDAEFWRLSCNGLHRIDLTSGSSEKPSNFIFICPKIL